MKRCNKCQLDFTDSATICRQCSGALVDVSQPADGVVHCTQCGAVAKATWKFCKRCGTRMEDVEEALPAAPELSPRQPLQPSANVLIEGAELAASGSRAREPWEPPCMEERRTPMERRCPRCHTALGADVQFCDVCGAALNKMTTSRPLGRPTAPVLEEQEPRRAEFVPVAASGPVALTLGGYAEARQLSEAEALSPDERRTFKRAFIGLIAIVTIVVLVFVVRLLWSAASGAKPAERPVSAVTAPEKKKETPRLFPVTFGLEPIEKEDQLAGGHAHVLVKLDDQAVFIIRDEGAYDSAMDRAKAVADNLRQAAANLQLDRASGFRVVDRPEGPTIVQVMPTLKREKELEIVSISRHDLSGYVRRSHGSVTAAQLAEWWLNRLKDRVNLFVKGESLRLTVTDEDGRLLADLYDRAEKESPGGSPTREALSQALRTLSPEQRRLLSYEGVRAFPNQKDHHEQK